MKKSYILGFPNLPLIFFPKSLSLPSVFLISTNYVKLQSYTWHFLLFPHSSYQAIVTLSSKQIQEFTTLSNKIYAHHTFSSTTLFSYQVLFSDLSSCFIFFLQKGQPSFSRTSHTTLLLCSMPFNDFPS